MPSVGVLSKAGAAGVTALIASAMPAADLESWGWRVPFLLAIPLGIVCLIMRLRIEDSPEFTASKLENKTDEKPFKALMARHRGPLGQVIVIVTIQNVGTYLGTVFVAVYFTTVLGFSKADSSLIILFALVVAALLIPVGGLLGNRIGSKKVLYYAYAAYAVVTLPSFLLMNQHSVSLAVLGLLVGMIPYILCQVGTYAALTEFFPVQVRHSGVAFGHSVGAVIGGGLSPYLATWLIDATGNTFIPAYILAGFGVLGIVFLRWVRPNPGGSHLFR
ncbi:MFS transporter [Paenarthrobacter nicotinovorans]|uniref:MFS transporter n=1 Tax=Paenarthrobacter nicotinovorans TaxID=29320 RepID=UPI00381A6F9B